jgi:uncharacterized protein (TIGR00255 family)
MIKSMTGFGKEIVSLSDKTIQIEIRSVNSKSFDFMCRIPAHFREKEPEMRRRTQEILQRGKIELSLNETNGGGSSVQINSMALQKHFETLRSSAHTLGISPESDLLAAILRIPDVLIPTEEHLSDLEWREIFDGIDKACLALDDFRQKEGLSLENDFKLRIESIQENQQKIQEFEEERVGHLRARFEKNLADIIDKSNIDENRLEQELIFYMEKLDITEEKVRLTQHLKYFMETLEEGNGQGKKLNFISQEIGRELNTLGSKANHAQIQHLIVQMKDELEKIKEQLLNIL